MKRDPEVRKAQILSAAADVFARDGYGGGRVDSIAAQAQVNKRMLYHYFGDKAGLFDAVIAEQLPVLCAFISGTVKHAGTAPEAPTQGQLETLWRLLAWDALRPTPAASADSLRASLADGHTTGDQHEAASPVVAYSVLQHLLPALAEHLGGSAGQLGRHIKALEAMSYAPKPRVKLAPAISRSGSQ